MIIKSFVGKGLHGYIDVEVNFFEDLTFLFGINGCGKTTVVRSIHALLTMSFAVLAETQFETLELNVENEGRAYRVSAKQSGGDVLVRVSGVSKSLVIRCYAPDSEAGGVQLDDTREEWYLRQANNCLDNDVVKTISSLPSPMYLGLERRAGGVAPRRVRAVDKLGRSAVFVSSLRFSLREASNYAALAYRDVIIAESQLKDQLRNDLILMAFKFEDKSKSGINLPNARGGGLTITADQEDKIIEALSRIDLGGSEVEALVKKFFAHLTEIESQLPPLQSVGAPRGLTPDEVQNIMRYQFNLTQFDRAKEMVRRVEEFTRQTAVIYESIEAYRHLMNEFLSVGKKRILLTMNGLKVIIDGVGERDIDALSSGEQQLIVLFSQLWFNPTLKQSNILIIDEPELSLHLGWQEKFVDALMRAGPLFQLILATHSPSIILDRDDRAVELIPGYVS